MVGVLGQVQPGSTNFTVKVLVRGTQGRLAAGLPVTVTGGQSPERVGNLDSSMSHLFLDDSHSSVMTDVDGTATQVRVKEVAGDRHHLDRHRSAQRNARHHQRPARDHAGRRPRLGSLSVWIARLSVNRPTLATVTLAAIALAGIVSYLTLVNQQFPNIDFPTIEVPA